MNKKLNESIAMLKESMGYLIEEGINTKDLHRYIIRSLKQDLSDETTEIYRSSYEMYKEGDEWTYTLSNNDHIIAKILCKNTFSSTYKEGYPMVTSATIQMLGGE